MPYVEQFRAGVGQPNLVQFGSGQASHRRPRPELTALLPSLLISIPQNTSHSTPIRTQINPFNAKQKPGMERDNQQADARRLTAPPLL